MKLRHDAILLLCTIAIVYAQPEFCPQRVNRVLDRNNGEFFKALRKVESDGDLCQVSVTGTGSGGATLGQIGPYQISEEYFDEAVRNDMTLLGGGMSYRFLWGKGSKSFSERVIRSYLCSEAAKLDKAENVHFVTLARIHRAGAEVITDMSARAFGRMVINARRTGAVPSDSSETCDEECRPGQCCLGGRCHCINTDTLEVDECEEPCQSTVTGGLDVVFVLDASGSIGATNFESMKETVVTISSSLAIASSNTRSRVAVIVFSSSVRLEFNLNAHTDLNSLVQAIRRIRYTRGFTNTHLALRLLRESALSELLGVRPSFESTKVAVVITDGQSTNEPATRVEAARLHSETDFEVFAVGVGGGVDQTELEAIASNNNAVIQLSGFGPAELQRLEADITREACTAPATVNTEVQPMVSSVLGEGAVSYYRVRIPDEGLTFMFDLEMGRVLVCGSTSTRNPDCRDPSSYEWRCETNSYCDIFARGTSRKRRQTSTGFMFISIEGVEKNNSVTVQIVEGDETISEAISPTILTDSIIIHSDPLYEVPVTHTPPGMNATITSLCYQVHGQSGSYFSLISDDCIQVNALYAAMNNSNDGNFIKEVGIVAQDSKQNCAEIRMQANRCVPIIDGVAFNKSYDENGITVVKTGKQGYEVTIPNCKATQGDDVKFGIACFKTNDQKVIHFNVNRGSGIKPGAHGLIGQFWNVPVEVVSYSGNYSGPANNTYVVTVDHPDPNSPPRRFIAELHAATWDGKGEQCLYVGSAQSGAINEVDVPNDHVIEGTYNNYEVSGVFDSDFQYNQFQEDQCA